MKITIYEDELYPYYFVSTLAYSTDKTAEITDEEYQEHIKAREAFDAWQDKLEVLYKQNA